MIGARAFACAASLWLATAPAFAYRPMRTEDAAVAGRGVTQLEASYDYDRPDMQGGRHSGLLVPIHGLAGRLELSAEIPYVERRGDEASGLSDVRLVLKWLMAPATGRRPALTLKAVAKLDNGDVDRGLGSGDEDLALFLVGSKELVRTRWHAHVGYNRVGDSVQPELHDVFVYSIGVDRRVGGASHLVAEVSNNSNPLDGRDQHEREWLIGFIRELSPALALDAAVKRRISGDDPGYVLLFGASMTF